MVERKVVTTVDDLDGRDVADGQVVVVPFQYRNSPQYRLELSPENAAEFDRDMKKWLQAGKRALQAARSDGDVVVRAARPSKIDREQTAAIRAWARKKKLKVSPRGRIPQSVVDAFHAAHPGKDGK